MFRRNKRQSEVAAPSDAGQQPPQAGQQAPLTASLPPANANGQPYELVVFDGKGHAATMVFTTDSKGRRIQRLKNAKGFKAHLSHIVK